MRQKLNLLLETNRNINKLKIIHNNNIYYVLRIVYCVLCIALHLTIINNR